MTSIEFYGGVDEIGGNKILVGDTKTSFFLDFGMSFSKANLYFSEFLQPREGNGILDFAEFGLLPDIKGIYREDYLRHCGLNCEEKPSVEGVLISHGHMDHTAYIHHLREDIPIYLTEESNLILKMLEETGQAPFSDLLELKHEFYYVPNAKGTGYKRLQGKDAEVQREFKVVKPYETFEIGDFKIKSAPVDHSLPGATGYLIESDDEAIVYTGDLRFHGRRRDLTDKFVEEARKFKPTIMISEGTRIDEQPKGTELDIEKDANAAINNFKGLVVVNFSLRDLDRLLTFYNVAQANDRTLAVSLKQAYMLNLFKDYDYPKLKDIAIYIPRKGWGLLGDKYYARFGDSWNYPSDSSYTKYDYEKWEQEFFDLPNTITYKDIQQESDKYIFRCDFFELKELIDIKPESGMYIRSVSEPSKTDEESKIDYALVQRWLDHFHLPMKQMHVSGHARGNEILDMIRKIKPEKVYPVHTEKKKKFDVLKKDGIKVVYPELAK